MARIICDYCGTEYDDNLQRCPLCGTAAHAEHTQAEEDLPEQETKTRSRGRRRGAREAESADRIPKWLSILICVVLGIAVVIGALYAMYALGMFSSKKESSKEQTSLELPIDDAGTESDLDSKTETGSEIQSTDTETVNAGLCTGIVVEPSSVTLSSAGITTSVTATVQPETCTEKVLWASSDESICTVDSSGTITAVDGGTAQVTATCGDFSATVSVNCEFANSKENNATLDKTDFTLFSTGEQATIHVQDAPENATITWTSSNTGVCTVKDGVVTAVKAGTATVTADVNGRKLECIVRCNIEGSVVANDDNAESGGSFQLDHTDVTLGVGESFEISVIGGVSGGWNASDGSVISVDGNGIVTALGSGTATVYTTVGGQRLECIVRLK